MDSWAFFVIASLAFGAGLSFWSAQSSGRFGRGVSIGFLAGYGLAVAGAVIMTLPRNELGLALIAAVLGLPTFLIACLSGAALGWMVRRPG